MKRRPAIVTQAAIARAIRAAEKRKLAVTGVELSPDGSVRVLTAAPSDPPMTDLQRWVAAKDARKAERGRAP